MVVGRTVRSVERILLLKRIRAYFTLFWRTYVNRMLSFFVVFLLLLCCIITALWECEQLLPQVLRLMHCTHGAASASSTSIVHLYTCYFIHLLLWWFLVPIVIKIFITLWSCKTNEVHCMDFNKATEYKAKAKAEATSIKHISKAGTRPRPHHQGQGHLYTSHHTTIFIYSHLFLLFLDICKKMFSCTGIVIKLQFSLCRHKQPVLHGRSVLG